MKMSNEFTAKLIEILEEAQSAYKRSMKYFEISEDENTDEMKAIYWTRSEEYSGKCKGLLKAYEIFTGRAIKDYNIDWELLYCKTE